MKVNLVFKLVNYINEVLLMILTSFLTLSLMLKEYL